MANNKKIIFCTECGKKNDATSKYCTDCGAKLVSPKDLTKNSFEREQKSYEVTLKNMSSKISGATFIVAKVIVKSSIISFRPKQPTRYDTYSLKTFIVLEGKLRYASDVTDGVKEKILKDLGTDIDKNKIEWGTFSSISVGLRDKGWNAISCSGCQWFIWPMNGSTVKSLITIDYVNKKPRKNIVKGTVYSQEDINNDKALETLGTIVVILVFILIIVFLTQH